MDAIIKGEGADSFILNIASYEFEETQSVYDSNWLIMSGRIQSSETSWQFRDACLLTWEYKFLADWIRNIESAESPDGIGFLEPNLSFFKDNINGEQSLVVVFDQECLPPSNQDTTPETENTKYPYRRGDMIYPFRLNDFTAIADAIEAQIQKYPTRLPDSIPQEQPRYARRIDSPLIYIIPDDEGNPIFATMSYDNMIDYFFDTLGYSGFSDEDYRQYGLDAIKRDSILPQEAIEALEEDGEIEL